MRDIDVRVALRHRLLAQHKDELDTTLFVDELGLCGEVRVDVAVVNASLSGFELKSASDTLKRLPAQIEVYSRVLDYAVAVVAPKHAEGAAAMIPDWWGLILVSGWDGCTADLEEIAPAQMNPAIAGFSLAQLLWRAEVLAALIDVGAAAGCASKPKRVLWQRLVDTVELDELRAIVRSSLKARRNWRTATASAQVGRGLATSAAKSRS